MSYKLDIELSPKLEQYREKIEATIKPYIQIKAEISDELTWWQSKFGGLPYLPKGVEYPQNPYGDYLYLLAQINFAEVPPLEGFPEKGILQFYIADDDLYGLDFDDPTQQSGFRIFYFEHVDLQVENLITNFDFLPESPDYFPLNGCFSLKFASKFLPISVADYKFPMLVGQELYNLLEEDDYIFDEYTDKFPGGSHKIGGY
ncbi:MAG: YwqG family protein, partial [Xenococcaceae cyanobacterium]